MAISWNIVNNTGDAFDLVSDKVGRAIQKLSTRLRRFPPDAVHLQTILDQDVRRKAYQVSLNLRIPSNVLHVTKESKSLAGALDDAVRALALRLQKEKERRLGKRARKALAAKPDDGVSAFHSEPFVEGLEPQTRGDVITTVLGTDYDRLVRFVERQLKEYVVTGTIPKDCIDPRDIVDSVATEALSQPDLKPKHMDYPTWCSSLAFQETRNTVRRYLEEAEWSVPVDLDVEPEGTSMEGLAPEEFALSILHDMVEPEEATLADYIPDPAIPPPDVTAAERDMVASLKTLSREWPKLEREIFEMFYLEGLSPDDIALTLHCEEDTISESLRRIQNTLRRRLMHIADNF